MLCGRCYEEEKLYPAKCGDKPEEKAGLPMGMYHCPDCGAMLLSGMKHPDLCERCNERKHPLFDKGLVKNDRTRQT